MAVTLLTLLPVVKAARIVFPIPCPLLHCTDVLDNHIDPSHVEWPIWATIDTEFTGKPAPTTVKIDDPVDAVFTRTKLLSDPEPKDTPADEDPDIAPTLTEIRLDNPPPLAERQSTVVSADQDEI